MTALPPLRLNFADFYPGFDPYQNYFYEVLSTRYDVDISTNPELLVYSCYGTGYRQYTCKRVFVCWENRSTNFTECDFALTCDATRHPKQFRLPLYAVAHEGHLTPNKPDGRRLLAQKRGFCSFVVSSPYGETRNRFFDLLSAYKEISSGGKFRNNVGGPVADKISFLSGNKFNIAFENSAYPGYITEKIVDALRAGAVPIYWGDPLVEQDFNPRCFVNVLRFPSLEAAVARVREIDADDDEYVAMLESPWFRNDALPAFTNRPVILEKLVDVIESKSVPIAQRTRTPAFRARQLGERWRKRQRYRNRRS